ncbi:MAG: globin family protein [Limisphaerales bacterium]
MTEEQIKLVQDSWAKVVPISATAAELFYGRLFELGPSLRPMFKTDIKEQGKKLMTMIGVAVKGLSNLESIVGAVQDMGKRHAGYGVKDEHYDTVAAALLWTLEKGLEDGFTEEVKAAWVETYTLLATTMKDAAKEVELVAAGESVENVPWQQRTFR